MEKLGERNSYQCRKCGGIVFTENRDDGTTPFMINCRATKDCDGSMESAFYRIPHQAKSVVPHYIWRKATPEELNAMDRASQYHAEQGGLFLYTNELIP